MAIFPMPGVTPGIYGPPTYYVEKCESGFVVANKQFCGSPKKIANQLLLRSREEKREESGRVYVWPFCIDTTSHLRSCRFTMDLQSETMTSSELDELSNQISNEFNRLVTFL